MFGATFSWGNVATAHGNSSTDKTVIVPLRPALKSRVATANQNHLIHW
jgi:hypothetical protein